MCGIAGLEIHFVGQASIVVHCLHGAKWQATMIIQVTAAANPIL